MSIRFFYFLKRLKREKKRWLLNRFYIVSEAMPFFADLAVRSRGIRSYRATRSYADHSIK